MRESNHRGEPRRALDPGGRSEYGDCMDDDDFDSNDLLLELLALTDEQMAYVLPELGETVYAQPNGPALLERMIEQARRASEYTFHAIFHGGPFDGQGLNFDPKRYGDSISLPSHDRALTENEVMESIRDRRKIDAPRTMFHYTRRPGSEPIVAGAIVDFELTGSGPRD
jgi:hypothetical protein